MGTDRADRDGPSWPQARVEARAVLRDASRWQLRESRWLEVGDATDAVAAALDGEDAQALVDAVGQLEEFGPLRVVARLGDAPRKPAPREVRERINKLIDVLGPDEDPVPDSDSDGDSEPEPGRGDDRPAG